MVKIIDADALFDKYISDYVYKNIGKVKPEEIENQIPVLYERFGKEPLKELDGKSPETYYRSFNAEELVSALKTHIDKKVPVSDFLCEALRDGDTETALLNALGDEKDEEFVLYVMNVLNDKNCDKVTDKYLEFILWGGSEPIRELAAEVLCGFSDKVKDRIIAEYKDASAPIKEIFAEILCNATKCDRIFDILINGFVQNPDKTAYYCSLLSKYGDDRALPFLYSAIENEKIDYADFEELRFCIETLGGVYDKKRDFSSDAIRKKCKGEKTATAGKDNNPEDYKS